MSAPAHEPMKLETGMGRSPDPITAALTDIYVRLVSERRGLVADYIPQLSTANPNWFGLALVSLEGCLYQSGDAEIPFTIQSVSKPFVYALALADLGLEAVIERVGVEPSGDAFNAISLEPESGRPSNPMVNAGAIVTASLVQASDSTERFERIRSTLSAFAGRPLTLDEAVFASEWETGDRNRALAYLMKNAGSLRCSVDEAIAVYFQQCSLQVTAVDLAVMAATLANGGINPRTGVTVVQPQVAEHVLAVMATCGMYDYAGEWLLRVGLPAKSGVAGGLVAASPGQFGIGLFSPPLDERGNSVRAVAASHELAERFQIHLMHYPGRSAPAIYRSGTLQTISSSCHRRRLERDVLNREGHAVIIQAIQGDIEFAAAETILRSLGEVLNSEREAIAWLILDLHRVSRLHAVAAQMLTALALDLKERGIRLAIVDMHQRHLIPCADFEQSSLNEVLERCEDILLASHQALLSPETSLAAEDHDLLASLNRQTRELLIEAMIAQEYEVEARILAAPEDRLFLILSGQVAIAQTQLKSELSSQRLGSMRAGTAVSQVLGLRPKRDRPLYYAETPVSGLLLTQSQLDHLREAHPSVVADLWLSMAAAGMLVEGR
jgi:glutaminase